MELIKLGERTYCLKNPTNIGIYQISDTEVYLIDTGNDKDAGKKIIKIITENNWQIKGIISTHSNSDHIGGNKVISERLNVPIYANQIETGFVNYPILEPSFLYGSKPFRDLQNKFLMAQPSKALEIANNLPEGLEYFNLKGHFFDMIGIKTKDDVYFLADSLFSQETISKYHLFFLYDVKEYLNTLNYLKTLKGTYYVASHIEPLKDITEIIKINEDKIAEILKTMLDICKSAKTFEEIEKEIFEIYHLTMNLNQYYLVGSTIKAYLTYLIDEQQVTYYFQANKMYFKATE